MLRSQARAPQKLQREIVAITANIGARGLGARLGRRVGPRVPGEVQHLRLHVRGHMRASLRGRAAAHASAAEALLHLRRPV